MPNTHPGVQKHSLKRASVQITRGTNLSIIQIFYDTMVEHDLLIRFKYITGLAGSCFDEFNQICEDLNQMNIELFKEFSPEKRGRF